MSDLNALILALLKQGEGFDYGAPPEVRAHFKACKSVYVSHFNVITANYPSLYTTIYANIGCADLDDPYGFEYRDYGTLESISAEVARQAELLSE